MMTVVDLNTYPYLETVMDTFPQRQARIIDINRYWRTGGTDWAQLKENFDGVVIAAGTGMWVDKLLQEHIDRAKEFGVPYATYHIPDPLQNMAEQAHWYSEQYGVEDGKCWFDWETPYTGSREPTATEAKIYLDTLNQMSVMNAGIYSRWEILKRMGPPSWLNNYDLWIARYLFEAPVYTTKYRRYEPFIEQRGWKLPPEMIGTGLESNVVAWQFTDYGDARYYCANFKTNDPVYIYGMTSADLNVSMDGVDTFMEWFGWQEPSEPEPNPEPTCCEKFRAFLDKLRGTLNETYENMGWDIE